MNQKSLIPITTLILVISLCFFGAITAKEGKTQQARKPSSKPYQSLPKKIKDISARASANKHIIEQKAKHIQKMRRDLVAIKRMLKQIQVQKRKKRRMARRYKRVKICNYYGKEQKEECYYRYVQRK